MKKKRIVLLPLIIVLIMAIFPLTGCAAGGGGPAIITPTLGSPYEQLSQQELQQIFSDSMKNQTNLKTYKFDMDMNMFTNITGAQSGKMDMLTKSSGATNLVSHQEQYRMEMDINVEGMGYPGGSQSLSYDIYQMTDWIYMKMEMPGMGEQWMKMPMSDEMNEQLNLVDQQMGPLESAVNIGLLGYANVDGTECYVLSIIPDLEDLMEWISKQQGATQDIDWGDISNLSDIFKNIEYTYYITRDSRLPKKIVANMQMDFTAEQAGTLSSDFDKMTMNISVDMTLYSYNEPLSITLPAEAQNAPEVSEDMLQ